MSNDSRRFMIGIDIIDLCDPLLHERKDRSLSLIVGAEDDFPDHPQLFWLLWTAKEAAFKARRNIISFKPTTVPIQLTEKDKKITFQSEELKGEIEVKKDFVLAKAWLEEADFACEIIEVNTSDWSNEIRSQLTNHLQGTGSRETLSQDEAGLPILVPSHSPVSFTHHGKFGAFAYPTEMVENKTSKR